MTIPLEPEKIYHIYNHANGKDNLFYSDDNYFYFLKRYSEILLPILDTYAYCLMPNHFHWLVKIKSEKEIFDFLKLNNRIPEETLRFEEYKNLSSTIAGLIENIFSLQISKQFSNFFSSYSQALNKQRNRKGNLFIQTFKRKEIDTDEQLKDTLLYIHCNPTHHGIVANFEQWKFSSYSAYLTEKPSAVKREEPLKLFESKENFTFCHQEKIEKIKNKTLDEIFN